MCLSLYDSWNDYVFLMYDAIKGHNGVWSTVRFIPAARKKKQIHQRIGATRTCDILRKPSFPWQNLSKEEKYGHSTSIM